MPNVMRFANYKLHLLKDGEKECLINKLNLIRQIDFILYKYCIEELNKYELYPVWNMPGHRGTHYFPTEIDCEMWEDYLYSMREDG